MWEVRSPVGGIPANGFGLCECRFGLRVVMPGADGSSAADSFGEGVGCVNNNNFTIEFNNDSCI